MKTYYISRGFRDSRWPLSIITFRQEKNRFSVHILCFSCGIIFSLKAVIRMMNQGMYGLIEFYFLMITSGGCVQDYYFLIKFILVKKGGGSGSGAMVYRQHINMTAIFFHCFSLVRQSRTATPTMIGNNMKYKNNHAMRKQ